MRPACPRHIMSPTHLALQIDKIGYPCGCMTYLTPHTVGGVGVGVGVCHGNVGASQGSITNDSITYHHIPPPHHRRYTDDPSLYSYGVRGDLAESTILY